MMRLIETRDGLLRPFDGGGFEYEPVFYPVALPASPPVSAPSESPISSQPVLAHYPYGTVPGTASSPAPAPYNPVAYTPVTIMPAVVPTPTPAAPAPAATPSPTPTPPSSASAPANWFTADSAMLPGAKNWHLAALAAAAAILLLKGRK